MTEKLIADDIDEASTLHREALASVVFDLSRWIRRTVRNRRLSASKFKKAGRLAEARGLNEGADAMVEVYKHLKTLQEQHGETSARRSFILYKSQLTGVDRQSDDPTPEEIAEQCEKVRQQWSEAEERHRNQYRPAPVEFNEQKFLL